MQQENTSQHSSHLVSQRRRGRPFDWRDDSSSSFPTNDADSQYLFTNLSFYLPIYLSPLLQQATGYSTIIFLAFFFRLMHAMPSAAGTIASWLLPLFIWVKTQCCCCWIMAKWCNPKSLLAFSSSKTLRSYPGHHMLYLDRKVFLFPPWCWPPFLWLLSCCPSSKIFHGSFFTMMEFFKLLAIFTMPALVFSQFQLSRSTSWSHDLETTYVAYNSAVEIWEGSSLYIFPTDYCREI